MNAARILFVFSTVLFPITLIHGQTTANEGKFQEVVDKMEGDVLELASKVEKLYAARCSNTTFQNCGNSNYDDCLSLYSSQTCPAGGSYLIPQCGDGISCSGLFDFTASTVRIPGGLAIGPNGNPKDLEVIETICFTRMLDDWFQAKRAKDFQEWQDLNGEQPSNMFFGSHTGVFRIYPARQSENCGSFDPRLRPWYVAASSGKKNVVMVLDTSNSMNQRGSLQVMKLAAQRVVNTLSFKDYVALVTFNSVASAITDEKGFMLMATDENKRMLNKKIEALVAENKTNFYAGFQKVFEVFNASIDSENYADCNTAILFLTDGSKSNDATYLPDAEVIDFVAKGIEKVKEHIGKPVALFTYSIAGGSGAEYFPKTLACATELGVWTSIEQSEDILDSLSTYYRLFSLGLSSDMNFTAWVEPYAFQTGGVLGTTVSRPVYDRTREPPLFVGVVGIDFTLAALNAALGSNTNNESLNLLAEQSTADCSALNLTLCDLESYRQQGGGADAVCTSNCTTFIDTVAQRCTNVSQKLYPTNLWENTANKGKSYAERVCCSVGANTTSDQCPAQESSSDKNVGAIVGGVIGGIAGTCLLVWGLIWYCGGKLDDHGQKDVVTVSAPVYEAEEREIPKPPPVNPNSLPPPMQVRAGNI